MRSPEVAGRHGRRYNETRRQIEAAKELRRNFADFAVFPDDHRQALATKFDAFFSRDATMGVGYNTRPFRHILFENWVEHLALFLHW